MPLYEYKCGKCGSVSEHLVGVGGDQFDLACLSCGSADLKKMISIVSINHGAQPATCCGGHIAGECEGSCERQPAGHHSHGGGCGCH